MKKFACILMTVALLLASLPCALCETLTLGTIQFDVPSGWAGIVMTDDGTEYLLLMDYSTGFDAMVISADATQVAAYGAETVINAMRDNFLSDGTAYGNVTELFETNGYLWFNSYIIDSDIEAAFAVALDGSAVLYVYGGEDMTRAALGMIVTDTAAQAGTVSE